MSDTRLDNLETSQHVPARTYQAHLLRDHTAEFNASYRLYRSIESSNHTTKSDALRDCRCFSWFLRDAETGIVRISSNHCRLRWCPLCGAAKAAQVSAAIQQWLQDVPTPRMLTLTLKHSNAPLADQIDSIYTFFQSFRRRKWLKEAISGGIWFFQVHRVGGSGAWHPHIHILLDSGYLPKARLSDDWRDTTHGSYIVDIKRITDNKASCDYVARYVARPAKLADLDLSSAQELLQALHGRRLAGSWGSAHGVCLSGKSQKPDGNWQRLGTWRTLSELYAYSDVARAIFKAWATGKPLNQGVSLMDVDHFIDFGDGDFYLDGAADELVERIDDG